MKLSYRCLSYPVQMTSTLMQSTWVIGQFRGLVYRVSRPVLVHKKSEKVLKYRGVPYQPIQSATVRIESEQNFNKSSSIVDRQIYKPS
ncbi:MAG: DUF4278 domain-containing protein [Microcoleaceae cyanobacterium]